MKQHEFDRQVFGDTAPPTEIDYDFYRCQAVAERHAAMAAFPGRAWATVHGALRALPRLRRKFVPMRANAARHQNLWPEDAGNARRGT
jgi:hypothetical protein